MKMINNQKITSAWKKNLNKILNKSSDTKDNQLLFQSINTGKNLELQECLFDDLLPISLSSSPISSIGSIDNVWIACSMLSRVSDTTNNLVVLEKEYPLGIIGAREILRGLLKNPTPYYFHDILAQEIMNRRFYLDIRNARLDKLLEQMHKTKNEFIILQNTKHSFSAVSIREILEIGALCKTNFQASDLADPKIKIFRRDDTVEDIIKSLIHDNTEVLVLENESLFIDPMAIIEKNRKVSEWEKIDHINGKSIDELKHQEKNLSQEITQIQKEIKKSQSKTLIITELSLLPVVVLLILISGLGNSIMDFTNDETTSFKTRHLIENLRGDTVDTWKSWRLVGTTLNVNVLNAKGLSENRIDVIKNAITSEESLEIDDSLTHKGPKGFSSTYFTGWAGALKHITTKDTLYNIPTDFNVITSNGGEGDVIITLSNLRDGDGYTGYTKSVVDGNEILKSFITIYDVTNLTDEQLGTILRHEFGHAIGLGHSTAPEDLMAPNIDMTVPYISECNINAVIDLYNGIQGSTVCEK